MLLVWPGPGRFLLRCYSFWLLRVESLDFSQAEKERTACIAEQIHKKKTIYTQNDPRLSFLVKLVVILLICSALQAVLFSQLEKNHVTQLATCSQKLKDM